MCPDDQGWLCPSAWDAQSLIPDTRVVLGPWSLKMKNKRKGTFLSFPTYVFIFPPHGSYCSKDNSYKLVDYVMRILAKDTAAALTGLASVG